MLPLVNLWRNGYYFNLSHTQFLNRYKLLSPYTWPHYNTNSAVESIAQIIRSVPLPAAEFAIGSSRIFIRSPRTVYELNEFRNLRLNFLATLIQKSYRCFSQRKHYQRMRQCQILIAKTWCSFRVIISKESFCLLHDYVFFYNVCFIYDYIICISKGLSLWNSFY